jgi:hypothetical protein
MSAPCFLLAETKYHQNLQIDSKGSEALYRLFDFVDRLACDLHLLHKDRLRVIESLIIVIRTQFLGNKIQKKNDVESASLQIHFLLQVTRQLFQDGVASLLCEFYLRHISCALHDVLDGMIVSRIRTRMGLERLDSSSL